MRCPDWIKRCRDLEAARRHQAELSDEERLRAAREEAIATLRERGWIAPEIERVLWP